MRVLALDGEMFCSSCAVAAGHRSSELSVVGEADTIVHCANGEMCRDRIDLGHIPKLFGSESRFVGSVCTEVLTVEGVKEMKKLMQRPNKEKTVFQERLHAVWGLYFWGLES